MLKRINGAFTGGALGALVDSFDIWILGRAGITGMLGIGLRPGFTPSWLYPRLVWGGIWGLLLLLPIMKNRPIGRGVLFSIVPTTFVLLVVFPGMGKGYLGLGFGLLTPLLVLLLNFLWGIVASLWLQGSR
ncbi:MAG: hypothetical protein M0017_05915 [Desulfobacteraceae bacterium]|nr:hypothetical protein [Desulfobacteraceae bacterium]